MSSDTDRVAHWFEAAETRPVGDSSVVLLAELNTDGIQALSASHWNDWAVTVRSMYPHAESVFPLPTGSIAKLPERFASLDALHKTVTGDARRPVSLVSRPNKSGGRAVFWVPASLAWFEGHFPGHPVVPGVVLIGWAVESIRASQLRPERIDAFRQVKFQRVVVPHTVLCLDWSIKDGSVHFEFRSIEGVHGKAQLAVRSTS